MQILLKTFGNIEIFVLEEFEMYVSRKEIVAEYDAKMRDASQREEQFRKRIQSTDTSSENPPNVSAEIPETLSTTITEQLPEVISTTTDVPVEPIVKIEKPAQIIDKVSLIPSEPTQIFVRHTANEQTTQAEYRPGIKLVSGHNALKSTIQNYLIDHDPLENDNQGKNYSSDKQMKFIRLFR